MGPNLQNGERLRPVDLAREHGLSTQAIRNYEEAGILPAAGRTPHGYRTYTPLHALALRAFVALVPGHGHQTATSIMQAVNQDAAEEAFRLIDESHAQLLDDRRTLQAVESAVRDLKPTAASGPAAVSEADGRFIGPLAGKLGIRPATLRKWERAATREPGTASTTRPTCGTPGWPISSGGAATCWSRSLRCSPRCGQPAGCNRWRPPCATGAAGYPPAGARC